MSDETVHHWDLSDKLSTCGQDIMHTPHTCGSPEWTEVTCPECLKSKLEPKIYRYTVRFLIVDDFGEILGRSRATIQQDIPRPSDVDDAACFDVRHTSKTIRREADKTGRPAGRIVITAVVAL